MRAVVQRVKKAEVEVSGKLVSRIGRGLLVFLGVAQSDEERSAVCLAKKISKLRLMADKQGKMNLSVGDVNGEILVVSQFTLIADTKRGNRPSFLKAAKPEKAKKLYQLFVETLQGEFEQNLEPSLKERLSQEAIAGQISHSFSKQRVLTGKFGKYMQVSLVNDGPVTIIMES